MWWRNHHRQTAFIESMTGHSHIMHGPVAFTNAILLKLLAVVSRRSLQKNGTPSNVNSDTPRMSIVQVQ
jgi:hypothetical protein